MKEINVTDLNDLVHQDSSLLLIDVRSESEYEAVHALPVKRLILHTEIADSAANLPADRETPIYLICRSGRRSGIAAKALTDLGYRNVYNVDGGTNAWVKAGLPTGKGRGILSPAGP
jgi:rhodanese-related sulfurtransferase